MDRRKILIVWWIFLIPLSIVIGIIFLLRWDPAPTPKLLTINQRSFAADTTWNRIVRVMLPDWVTWSAYQSFDTRSKQQPFEIIRVSSNPDITLTYYTQASGLSDHPFIQPIFLRYADAWFLPRVIDPRVFVSSRPLPQWISWSTIQSIFGSSLISPGSAIDKSLYRKNQERFPWAFQTLLDRYATYPWLFEEIDDILAITPRPMCDVICEASKWNLSSVYLSQITGTMTQTWFVPSLSISYLDSTVLAWRMIWRSFDPASLPAQQFITIRYQSSPPTRWLIPTVSAWSHIAMSKTLEYVISPDNKTISLSDITPLWDKSISLDARQAQYKK